MPDNTNQSTFERDNAFHFHSLGGNLALLLPNILGAAFTATTTHALNPGGGLQSDSDMLANETSIVKCLAMALLLVLVIFYGKRHPSSKGLVPLWLGYVIAIATACSLVAVVATQFLHGETSFSFLMVGAAASTISTLADFFWLASMCGAGPVQIFLFVFCARFLRESLVLTLTFMPQFEYILCALALIGQVICIRYIQIKRLGGSLDAPISTQSLPSPKFSYFSGFESNLGDKHFISSCVMCFAMLSAANGLLRGFPDGSPIFFTVETKLLSVFLILGLLLLGIIASLRNPPLRLLAGSWFVILLLICFGIIAFAALPAQREVGAVFATAYNEAMQVSRWYISIALMSLGRRSQLYYVLTTYLVFLLPRAVLRTLSLQMFPVGQTDPFCVGSIIFVIVIFAELFMTLSLASIATKRNAEAFSKKATVLERMLGLDEDASLGDMKLAVMKERVATIGRTFKLTDRETEVLTLFIYGHTQAKVAEELFVTQSTVHAHIRHIYTKTGFHSRQDILNYLESNENIMNKPQN